MLVEALAVSTGSVAPVGDRSLVESERNNDGLHRTAVLAHVWGEIVVRRPSSRGFPLFYGVSSAMHAVASE